MEYREAIKILLKMKEDYNLKPEEKEAILTAIGTLDCGALMDNRLKKVMKTIKEKKKNII